MNEKEKKEMKEIKEENEEKNEEKTVPESKPEEVTAQTLDGAVDALGSGKMVLVHPIFSNNQEVKELEYDFRALTGWEYAECMDRDPEGGKNVFKITDKQALYLFAKAAAKKTENVDARDIERNLLIDDSVKAVQVATLFFIAVSRAGNSRLSKS